MSKIDLGQVCEKQPKNKLGRKHRRDMKLQELEKQLQFAESRCGTLKQQLDYIKQLYGSESYLTRDKDNKSYTSPKTDLGDGDADNASCFNCANTLKRNSSIADSKARNVFEREDELGPDTELQSTSKTKTCYSNSQYNGAKIKSGQEEKKLGNFPKPKAHLKLLKVNKRKNFKKFKGRKKLEETAEVGNVVSQSHGQLWQDPLVEIYKNSALKAESESGLEIVFNGRRTRTSKDINIPPQKLRQDAEVKEEDLKEEIYGVSSTGKIPSSSNEKKGNNEGGAISNKDSHETTQVLQNKQNGTVDFLRKDNCFFEPEKGYCQPTISSKKKQVDKDIYSCFRNINIKNIPFIAAKSTAPSHNIGVNIQQVLSIMKKKNPLNENLASLSTMGNSENSLLTILASKRGNVKTTLENEGFSEVSSHALGFSESKKKLERIRSHLSHWNGNFENDKEKEKFHEDIPESVKNTSEYDQDETEWSFKVNKLKKVLVFLHEDFMFLSQKYKKLQKKLVKRNITTIEAKGELAEIEKDLEKKEEEITVVIGLYKEVLYLKEILKKLQDKYDLVANKNISTPAGLQQTNSSTHFQMQSLLRKIQNFQDRLKS